MEPNKSKNYANKYFEQNSDFLFAFNGKKILGASSGLKHFDELLEGFFGLVGITGEPGKGKTSFAIQTACHNCFTNSKKIPVLYVSLEVNKDLLIFKMISHITGIPLKKILKGGLNFQESQQVLEAIESIDNNVCLMIIDSEEATFENVKQCIKFLKEDFIKNYGYSEEVLTIIDYFNLWKDVPKGSLITNPLERTNIQMQEWIKIRNDTNSNFAIILAKNKQGYRKQDLGVIKGSGDLEYGLETVISLEEPPEEYPISDYPKNEATGFMEVNTIACIMKNRWGEAKKMIPFYFNGAKNKFVEPS